MNLWEEWQWRGMIYQISEGVEEVLNRQKVVAYIGFDPTSSSLHMGNLLPIVALKWLQEAGHRPIAVVGSGTGLIGDPSGKITERPLLEKQKAMENAQSIARQLEHFLQSEVPILQNADWLSRLPLLNFLRDVGKHFSVNNLLDKESIRLRLNSQEGISFTEFSYILLQAYDFLYLFDHYNCILQLGGSDQWGNITAGIELIRRLRGAKAYGIVFPLLLTSAGVKFGKTEAGAIWLDPSLTSPYRFYQFCVNAPDEDVISYLKWFTFLPRDHIQKLEESIRKEPEKREAQKTFAREVTAFVHGATALAQAEKASRVLFGEDFTGIEKETLEEIFEDVPYTTISSRELSGDGIAVIDLLTRTGLVTSRSDARRLIQSGGFYLNNIRITDANLRANFSHSLFHQCIVLRKGAKQYYLVKIVE